jgi:hypothetical protein
MRSLPKKQLFVVERLGEVWSSLGMMIFNIES